MVKLIPAVKELKEECGFLTTKAISFDNKNFGSKIIKALDKLPYAESGAKFTAEITGGEGECYELTVKENEIMVNAESESGVFYAIQTLRQLFLAERVPCLYIKDYPDFKYRGFYQDITRGRMAKIETLKNLIDMAAYYKINAFQLYVEHVYEFEECRDINDETNCITAKELRELDEYCKDNFIDFQPSLSTFGHMFEILNIEKFRHLAVLQGYENDKNRWVDRHAHHTINPEKEESFKLVKSLIDQYAPNFTSDYFNICCDETFDLKSSFPEEVETELYVEFVKKIIAHVKSKNKKVMMWADILLKHPETLNELPDDTLFLNWCYRPEPPEDSVKKFSEFGKKQIVCPGTSSWWRFCETIAYGESNITKLAEYGYKYGAIGVLTTNWGDWGHPSSIDCASYGLTLGAAKSWAIDTKPNEEFRNNVNTLLYHSPNGYEFISKISEAHSLFDWQNFIKAVFAHREGAEYNNPISKEALEKVQEVYRTLMPRLANEEWEYGDFKEEFMNALSAVCITAEFAGKLSGLSVERLTNTEEFLARYGNKWLEKNKASDLWRLEEIFRYCEEKL